MKVPIHRPRRTALLFAIAAVVGFTAVGGIVTFAGSEDPPKRKPERDAPGTVTIAQLPAGRHLTGSEGRVVHGPFIAHGIDDAIALPPDPRSSTGRRFEDAQVKSMADLVPSVFPEAPILPAGYRLVAGGARFAYPLDGPREIAEAGAQFSNDRGYPIRIARWDPPGFAGGGAFGVPVPKDGPIQVTLADLNGRPAVFKHRRAGVSTPELQEIYFAAGPTMVSVESYLDDFSVLQAVALSISDAFAKAGE